jgi:hypothetical protein
MRRDKESLATIPPEEMLKDMLTDMRSFISILGVWADVLTGEVYQELRPQAVEALRMCCKNMQRSHDEAKIYLEERKKIEANDA